MKKLFFALALAIISISGAAAQSKVGHVNSQKVLDTIPSRQAAMKEIEQLQNMGIKELTEMDSTLNVKLTIYEQQKNTWAELARKNYENQLRDLQARIQAREQAIDRDIQMAGNEANRKALEQVKTAVATVSKLKKLNYVIDESVLLYYTDGIDITNEVITEVIRLDKATPAPKPQ